MQALDKKLFRDFARLWLQGLAIAVVLAGVAVILMSVGMSRALNETRAAYYDDNRFAHVFASARRAPDSLLPRPAGHRRCLCRSRPQVQRLCGARPSRAAPSPPPGRS
jgi:hypothetical protein